MFSLARLLEVIVYAVAVGIFIKIFATAWRYLWDIETGRGEAGALAGAIIALLVVWGIDRGPRVAPAIAALLIAGYFLVKLVKKYVGG